MLQRDRLQARLKEMGGSPDYVKLAAEILSIRNAAPQLAERLVRQALVLEERRSSWLQLGERIVAAAPETPGVYILRDAQQRPLYVGKAVNLRRRLRTHFAARRWKVLKPGMSQVDDAVWKEVGSELEALLLEASWIRELAPSQNVQRGDPSSERPLPASVVRDVIVLMPSVDSESVELVAARVDGPVQIHRSTRTGNRLHVDAKKLWTFFHRRPRRRPAENLALAPIVFSWLARRGAQATRIDARELMSAEDLRIRLEVAFSSPQLFEERLVIRNSRPI